MPKGFSFLDDPSVTGKQTGRLQINCTPEFEAEVKAVYAEVGGKSLNQFLLRCIRYALPMARASKPLKTVERIPLKPVSCMMSGSKCIARAALVLRRALGVARPSAHSRSDYIRLDFLSWVALDTLRRVKRRATSVRPRLS